MPQSQFRDAINCIYFKNSIAITTRVVKMENYPGLSFIYFIGGGLDLCDCYRYK